MTIDDIPYRTPTLRSLISVVAGCLPGFLLGLRTLTTEIHHAGVLTFTLPFMYGDLAHELKIEIQRHSQRPPAFAVTLTALHNLQAFADRGVKDLIKSAFSGLPVAVQSIERVNDNELVITIQTGA